MVVAEKLILKISGKNYQGRQLGMDVARAIAAMYIVGYLHLKTYQTTGMEWPHIMGEAYVSKIMLSLFMFISGYFMANYSFEDTGRDMKKFYLKRLLRFWPLYALAGITLFVIGYNPNFFKLFLTLTGMSTFVAQPGTLWFMSLLMLFYILTPVLLRGFSGLSNGGSSIFIRSMFVYSAVFIICVVLTSIYTRLGGGKFDERFFAYFPVYVFGIMTAKSDKMMVYIRK